jgi:hypothetical protein
MLYFLVKVGVTALLVAAISELARRHSFAAALLAALPLTSLLAILWLYRDTGDALQVARLAEGIFWLVLPSLAFFLVFPAAVRADLGFWPALALAVAATLVAYGALLGIDRLFGLKLLG